jgi:hypothetical protein
MTKTKTVPAVRLCVAGAAEDWHTVDGLSGHYHPLTAVPLDQPGLLSRDLLDAFLAHHGERVAAAAAVWETFRGEQIEKGLGDVGPFQTPSCPVELVELPETHVEDHAQMAREQRTRSARELAKARRAGRGGEPNVKAELGAAGAETQETN